MERFDIVAHKSGVGAPPSQAVVSTEPVNGHESNEASITPVTHDSPQPLSSPQKRQVHRSIELTAPQTRASRCRLIGREVDGSFASRADILRILG